MCELFIRFSELLTKDERVKINHIGLSYNKLHTF